MFDILKHKFVLVQILKDIYSDTELASILGFKGGTAVYLFYNLPRFSVDLDFNLLDLKKKELVLRKLEDILKNYGTVKKAQKKRFTLFFLLSYAQEQRNIKVEISERKFPDSYEIKDYLGISMKVLKKEDMFSHKLVSLLERKNIANRDLFDIYFFFKNNWPINKNLVELRTEMKFREYLKKCLRAIEDIDERYVLQGLGELLDENQKTWAKKNLKKELVFLLRFYSEKSK